MFCALKVSAEESQTLLNITGNTNKSMMVKMIPKIIYLILFQAFLIFSSSHAEKINKKIAKKNAYSEPIKMISTRTASMMRMS